MNDHLPAIPDDQQVERAGFRTLREQIADADTKINELVEAGDTEGLAWGIASVAILLRDLRTLENAAKTGLHKAMAANDQWEMIVEGLGEFSRVMSGGSTKTDWAPLKEMIRNRALVDTDTGEMIDDPAEAVDRCLELIFEVAPLTPSTNARVGAMKSTLGLDKDQIDDINEKQAKRPSVRFDPSATEKKERG